MKTLFIGGVKSGKSRLAEEYVLSQAKEKPIYLATAEFFDEEMRQRIKVHQQRRQDRFITVEEPVNLCGVLAGHTAPILLECVTMWLNNMLYLQTPEKNIWQELANIVHSPYELTFVLNEVGTGVIPENALARQFVDLSGKAAQLLGTHCDAVYFCCAGIAQKIK